DWDFVYEMVKDYLEYGGQIDPEFAEQARNALGFVDWNLLQQLPRDPHPSRAMRPLPESARPLVVEMARRHTPLRDIMFRNTRDLLREYVRQGLLNENVPTREPQRVWIPMRPEEMRLYLRIEEYISDFYRKYENERKGLGFVMTVYRRRLTSSFYAVRQSLERRLEFLEGRAEQAFDDDDLEQADLEQDVTEILDDDQRSLYQEEIDYVESFISDLQHLSMHDSKTEQLIQDLNTIFRQRETAIVFTQYTDTMDYLRDKLLQVYGSQVACYSGRGGEIWNGIAWVGVTKEDIKQTFRAGEDVKILVCTEAASEGLNLQTCGVLINYDMPWNPMRVEQRIGRIDRIGQVHDEVWIRNYFYEETVEARVYQALAHRINWFEGVVGDLQPILARVGRAIERVVMAAPDEREQVLAGELDEIERGLDQRDSDILNVYEGSESVHPWAGLAAPITLSELERCFLESGYFEHQIAPNPAIETTYLVTTSQGQAAITFDPETFDRFPNSLRLLSYGDQVLDELLSRVPVPEEDERRGIVRVSSADSVHLKAYYGLNQQNQPVSLQTLQDLLSVIEDTSENTVWSETAYQWAKQDFERHLGSAHEEYDSITSLRFQSTHSALVEKAVQIVHRAILLELMQSGHFSNVDDAWRAVIANEQSSQSLLRHGYPFTALLRLAAARIGGSNIPNPLPESLANANSEQLRRMFLNLKQEGQVLLARMGRTQDRQENRTHDLNTQPLFFRI
ncbi:MAG: DEAD/DEAH box helicase, partial [Anaerolineales bacterium]|nr:DEAD/DEAH box helicase [Anaerolineales bacterium]